MNEPRTRRINFVISEKEYEKIRCKMRECGISNMSGYLRKMAIDGAVVKLNTDFLNETVTQLKGIGRNINQLTKRANSGEKVVASEIKAFENQLEEIWKDLRILINQFAEILAG